VEISCLKVIWDALTGRTGLPNHRVWPSTRGHHIFDLLVEPALTLERSMLQERMGGDRGEGRFKKVGKNEAKRD
jgi:hypothetical protein